jgi:hypothetical protein
MESDSLLGEVGLAGTYLALGDRRKSELSNHHSPISKILLH